MRVRKRHTHPLRRTPSRHPIIITIAPPHAEPPSLERSRDRIDIDARVFIYSHFPAKMDRQHAPLPEQIGVSYCVAAVFNCIVLRGRRV